MESKAHFPEIDFSRKHKFNIILAVTIGNLLEWYEIYLYVYWAPVISKIFFDGESELKRLSSTFLVFALGFLARPLGGLFFGRLGDRIGRRKALILSLAMMTVPTFATGLLPTYAEIGMAAPILLCIIRFLQAFPAGGELPGAACYLYESAKVEKRRFLASFSSLGFQVGILICTLESIVLESFMSDDQLITWGWRISFIIGGLLGIGTIYLRYALHETPLYKEMSRHEQLVKEPLLGVLNQHKKGIFIGILYCALNSSAFYLLTVNIPTFIGQLMGSSYKNSLIVLCILLLVITIPLPLFGKLADRYNNKKILVGSTLGMIFLLYPMYISIANSSLVYLGIILFVYSMFFTCLSALAPYIICDLFPTRVRFTCVAFSFNLCDAAIGGFTPFIVLLLINFTQKQGSFVWLLLVTSLLSLTSFLLMKEGRHAKQ